MVNLLIEKKREEMQVVYMVLAADEYSGEDPVVMSVYYSKDSAANKVKELHSSTRGVVAYVEEIEVQE